MARVVFLGTPEFGVPILEALVDEHQVMAVVTQPDRPAGRGRHHLAVPPVKRVAQAHQLPILQPASLRRDRAAVEALRGAGADLFVLAAFGQILRPDVLAIPKHGCIGIHASLLPKLRGAAPIPASILRGDPETGITLMLTDAGMDTGPIIAQRSLSIAARDTTDTLTVKLSRLGAQLLIEMIPAWLAGHVVPQPQDDTMATYAPPIEKSAGHIDWQCSAAEIDRLIRAYTPWPGTFTHLHDQVLKIWSGHPVPVNKPDAPGTVVLCGRNIGVTCGNGLLVLETVQLAGKKAMGARQFAQGQREFVGTILD